MILSDETLRRMIAEKSIVVDPIEPYQVQTGVHRPSSGAAFPEDRREHAGEPDAGQ